MSTAPNNPVSVVSRRQPAHRSVSLLHSSKQPSNFAFLQPQRKTSPNDRSSGSSNSPSSLQPNGGKGSSGESSNAERWFEKSNNHVRDTSTTFADNEPPYFLHNNSSSDDTSPAALQQKLAQYNGASGTANSLPRHAALLHIGTDGSSTDDFRGVIDDLTIENKKLKRRLKKYEKLHDSHLKDEKLFEVRIHGLPAEKKRELEETLRKFASSLHQPDSTGIGYEAIPALFKPQVTTSSQASLLNADSAYASLSTSGQGSSSHSAVEKKHKKFVHSAAVRSRNIHSYLHQIPEGLLPNANPANISDAAKKKLVARRLEQIFSGKGATLDGHQQPLQQQEISQSAAFADRSATEALGQRTYDEGNREAQIMLMDIEEQSAADATLGKRPKLDESAARKDMQLLHRNSDGVSPKFSVEQRPTRPLDLDPHRAQIPAENLKYMRHLGFSPLDLDSDKSPEDGHGWIYLNLLINMAQLHTINVTSDFVRKAVIEMSDLFELSTDGRKIRWKGKKYQDNSSGGFGSLNARTNEDAIVDGSPRKRLKLKHQNTRACSNRSALEGSQRELAESNKLIYTPLFFHQDTDDEEEESSSSDDEDISEDYPMPLAGDSSGMTSSGVRTTSTKKQKKIDDGPIIFYNNARFCTDLSGERNSDGNPNAPVYSVVSLQPVGQPAPSSVGSMEKRGPLDQASELPEPMDLHDNPIPESMELSFPHQSPLSMHSSSSTSSTSVNLEVTGIGGVWPSDHFAIRVESRHARVAHSTNPSTRVKHVAPQIARLLKNKEATHKANFLIDEKVVRSTRRELAPSQLPPALSYMPFGDDSISEDDSDHDDQESFAPHFPVAFPPATALQMFELPTQIESEQESDDDTSDAESDGSLDLLATAREADPEAIRACEREYDANMAERLAEEIPPGSSAATAGGGSGFASPSSGVGRDEYRRAVREARGRPADVPRIKTDESLVVHPASAVDGVSSKDDGDEEMIDASS